MSRLTSLALVAAAGVSTIALNDAVTFGLTGRSSSASDEYGVSLGWAVSALVHVVAYALFCALLVTRGRAIDGGGRARSLVRWSLVATLAFLAAGMLGQVVAGLVIGSLSQPPGWLGALIGVAFVWMFLGSFLLGFLLLRRGPALRPAAWTLIGVFPALGLALLLGVLGSPFAHPAYPEVFSAFGLALVGLVPRTHAVPDGPARVRQGIPDHTGAAL